MFVLISWSNIAGQSSRALQISKFAASRIYLENLKPLENFTLEKSRRLICKFSNLYFDNDYVRAAEISAEEALAAH